MKMREALILYNERNTNKRSFINNFSNNKANFNIGFCMNSKFTF